jgi:chaperonin GroES
MGKEKNQRAVVVAVGPGKRTINGNLIPTTVKVGQTVIIPTMGFTRMEFDGEEYYVGPENQLLARITDEDYQQELPF